MPYHHGNLRSALVDAAVELAEKDGPETLALREVARHVGVSHNAAYRHFADREALVRAASARAHTAFAELMRDRIAGVAGTGADAAYGRLAEAGRAYVQFATEHAGLFRTITTFPLGEIAPDSDVPSCYEQLVACLDELVEVGAVTPERRQNAEIAAVSAVHGFAMLVGDGPWRMSGPDEYEAGLAVVLRTFREGL